MKIAIGNDHAAVEMKYAMIKYLENHGHEVINYGTDKSERCDYPEFALKVAKDVAANTVDFGVLICGTGIGMSIAANKVNGIRAAVCSEPVSARFAKEHNNANIICFGARIVGEQMAIDILDSYMNAEFLEGRHQNRIDIISKSERSAL